MKRVLANTSASSRGDTRRASVIHIKKVSKGWKTKKSCERIVERPVEGWNM